MVQTESMNDVSRSRDGLSYPEILFILSVLLVFLSLALPAYITVRDTYRSRIAYAELRILFSAARQFNQEYRTWPSYKAPERGDVRYGDKLSNAFVMHVLQAVDAEGNAGHKENPQRIDFIRMVGNAAPSLRFREDGAVIDPWGKPYQFIFDANYDNACSIPNSLHGSVLGTGVAVWSGGPDGKPDSRDDLLSWRY